MIWKPDRAKNREHKIHAIRFANFQTLFQEFCIRHSGELTKGSLKKFAEQVNISDRYLSHVKNRRKSIGNELARRIEDGLELESGYMDLVHDSAVVPDEICEAQFREKLTALYRADPVRARRMLATWLVERAVDADLNLGLRDRQFYKSMNAAGITNFRIVKVAGIYLIFNFRKEKYYVGATTNWHARVSDHKSTLNRGLHPNMYLQEDWISDGPEVFVFRMIEVFSEPTDAILCGREDFWIDVLDAANRQLGYNMHPNSSGKGYRTRW